MPPNRAQIRNIVLDENPRERKLSDLGKLEKVILKKYYNY